MKRSRFVIDEASDEDGSDGEDVEEEDSDVDANGNVNGLINDASEEGSSDDDARSEEGASRHDTHHRGPAYLDREAAYLERARDPRYKAPSDSGDGGSKDERASESQCRWSEDDKSETGARERIIPLEEHRRARRREHRLQPNLPELQPTQGYRRTVGDGMPEHLLPPSAPPLPTAAPPPLPARPLPSAVAAEARSTGQQHAKEGKARKTIGGGPVRGAPSRKKAKRAPLAKPGDITDFFDRALRTSVLGCVFWAASAGNIDFQRIGALQNEATRMPDFGTVRDMDGEEVELVPTRDRSLLLEAPCGFGKTTKLLEWLKRELKEHPDRPVIFISCRRVHAIDLDKDCQTVLKGMGFVAYCDGKGEARGAKKRLEGKTRVIVSFPSFGALVASGEMSRFEGGYIIYDEVRSIAGGIHRATDPNREPLVKNPQPILDHLRTLSSSCVEVFMDADASVCPRVMRFMRSVMAPGKRVLHVQFATVPSGMRRELAYTWDCNAVTGANVWRAWVREKLERVRADGEQRLLIGCAGRMQCEDTLRYLLQLRGVPRDKIACYTGGPDSNLEDFKDADASWKDKWVVIANTTLTVAVDLKLNFGGLFLRTSKNDAGMMSDLLQMIVRARVVSDTTIYTLIDGRPLLKGGLGGESDFRTTIKETYERARSAVLDTSGPAQVTLRNERSVAGDERDAPRRLTHETLELYASSTTDLERTLNTRHHAAWCFHLARHATRQWELRELHLPEYTDGTDAPCPDASTDESDDEERPSSRYELVHRMWREREAQLDEHIEWTLFNGSNLSKQQRFELLVPPGTGGQHASIAEMEKAVDEVERTLRPIGRFVSTVDERTGELLPDIDKYEFIRAHGRCIERRVQLATLNDHDLLRMDASRRERGMLATPEAQLSLSDIKEKMRGLATHLKMPLEELYMPTRVWHEGDYVVDLHNANIGSAVTSERKSAFEGLKTRLHALGVKNLGNRKVFGVLGNALQRLVGVKAEPTKRRKTLPNGKETSVWVTSAGFTRIGEHLDAEWRIWHIDRHELVLPNFYYDDAAHDAPVVLPAVSDASTRQPGYSQASLDGMIDALQPQHESMECGELYEALLLLRNNLHPAINGEHLHTEHYLREQPGMGVRSVGGNLFGNAERLLRNLLDAAKEEGEAGEYHPGVRAALVADRYHRLHLPHPTTTLAHAEARRRGIPCTRLEQAAEYLTLKGTRAKLPPNVTEALKQAGAADLWRAVRLDGMIPTSAFGRALRTDVVSLRDELFRNPEWRERVDIAMGAAFEDARMMSTSTDEEVTAGEEGRRCEVWRLLLDELQDEAVRTIDSAVAEVEWRARGLWQTRREQGPYARRCCVYIEPPAPAAGVDHADLDDARDAAQEDLQERFGGCKLLVVRGDAEYHGKQAAWLEMLRTSVARLEGAGGDADGADEMEE